MVGSPPPVHVRTQLSGLSAGADEHLYARAGHGHETDARLLVLLQLRIGEVPDGLVLSEETSRRVVA
jgi:hypothetical protein